MNHRKILIIGSNSFSGADFIDLLLEDPANEVVGISRSQEKSDMFLKFKRHDNPHYTFYQMDLNRDHDKIVDLLEKEKPEFIVNFAALLEPGYSWTKPEQWYQTNVMGLIPLAYYLKDQKWLKRYMHISTPEVYGSCSGRITEEAPANPTTPYAASKIAADQFLATLVKAFDFPMVTIRSTNVYGSHQQLFRIIPRSVIYMKLGRRIPLHGGGVAVKSFIHIRDVSRGELSALLHGRQGQIYHLSPDDQGWAVHAIVRKISDKLGFKFEDVTESVGERLGQDAAYVIDSARARKELEWSPRISIDEGIQEVTQWVEKYWEEIKCLPLDYEHKF